MDGFAEFYGRMREYSLISVMYGKRAVMTAPASQTDRHAPDVADEKHVFQWTVLSNNNAR